MRKALKNYADFLFCEAPHTIRTINEPKEEIKDENNDINKQEEKGWWFSETNKSYDALQTTDCDIGFDETLEHINSFFEKHGPIDGIFAFSQGASLGSILCHISYTNNEKYKFIRFQFSILVAGFKSGQTQHDIYYDMNNKINIPSLHLIGKSDKVIPSEMGLKLTNYFVNPKIHLHDAGHFIPVNAESKNVYIEFLTEMSKNNIE